MLKYKTDPDNEESVWNVNNTESEKPYYSRIIFSAANVFLLHILWVLIWISFLVSASLLFCYPGIPFLICSLLFIGSDFCSLLFCCDHLFWLGSVLGNGFLHTCSQVLVNGLIWLSILILTTPYYNAVIFLGINQ